MGSHPTRVHLIPLFLLFLVFAGNTAFAADVDHYKYQVRGKSAYASFHFFDASGCIHHSMHVSVAEDVVRSSSFDRYSSSYLGVSLYVVDRCDGWRTISSSHGSRVLEPGMLAFKGNLGEATVAAEVVLSDQVSGNTRTVGVDLTWTGTGEAWSGRERSVSEGGGYRSSYRYVGSSRDAEASGTVLLDGAELPAGTDAYAVLYNSRSGSMEVSRQD